MSINHILLSLLLGVSLIGCTNDLKFSKGKNGGLDINPPGACPDSVLADFVAPPSLVELGQAISLNYEEGEVSWFIQKPDGTVAALTGNSVSYTVAQLGRHSGRIEAVNSCGTIEVLNFVFDAFLPVGASSLIINRGEQYTSLAEVSLSLVSVGATEMYITESAGCNSGGQWEVYNTQKLRNLQGSNKDVTVYAKFKNPVGNASSCVSDSIVHDDIKPSLSISTAPSLYTNQSSANFGLAASDSGSGVDTYFCSIDSGNVSVCASVVNYTSLRDGAHVFSARVSDKAGNLSDWVQHTWNVDTVKPTLRFTSTPSNPSSVSNAGFSFEGSDLGSGVDGYECKLDAGNYGACVSPSSVVVSDGSHTYSVRNKDKAGNVSNPISYTWVTDATAPVIVITSAPANPSNQLDASFSFTVTENGLGISSVKCTLDGSQAVDCVSPVSYIGLANGTHSFSVVATDVVGNSGSASYNWLIDDKVIDQIIPIGNSGGSADILFVVDNSDSMYTELRESIPYRFENFLSDLGDLDYNIAITTSDARGSRPFEAGGFADILRTPVPGAGIALVPRQKTISPFMPNASRNFIATIMRPETICTEVGTHLCPQEGSLYEEPIRTTLMSIDRADTQFFFRSEAALHVVIVSDTDEGSGNYTYSNGTINERAIPNYSKPETLINRIQQKWPGKNLKVHAVIRRPLDKYCANSMALKGHILKMLADQTGGTTANICNRNERDTTQIKEIADAISGGGQASYTLNCEPADRNNDGVINADDFTVSYSPQPTYTPDMIISGRSLRFSPRLPSGTSVNLRYTCK